MGVADMRRRRLVWAVGSDPDKGQGMTPAERALYMAEQARKREAGQREQAREDRANNRLLMPISTAFIDSFIEVFGIPPAGRFTENGRTVQWDHRRK
jgi:hypothetical protein